MIDTETLFLLELSLAPGTVHDVMKHIHARTGRATPRPTAHRYLRKLVDQGLLVFEVVTEPNHHHRGPSAYARRRYSVTKSGRQLAQERLRKLGELVESYQEVLPDA